MAVTVLEIADANLIYRSVGLDLGRSGIGWQVCVGNTAAVVTLMRTGPRVCLADDCHLDEVGADVVVAVELDQCRCLVQRQLVLLDRVRRYFVRGQGNIRSTVPRQWAGSLGCVHDAARGFAAAR